MKFNEFKSMIIPFINVRGGDVVYPQESLDVATNTAIQDIYTQYNWGWSLLSKKINVADWTDSNGYYSIVIPDMKSVSSIQYYESNSLNPIEYTEAKVITELADNKWLQYGDVLIVSKPLDLTVSYYRDYVWDLFMVDSSSEIPMPNKMIPALYYLVLSQIDIIEVTQAERQTYSNYGKYENRIKILKQNDTALAVTIIGGNVN